ncbi:substrate-binding domain-containing protein [Okeania sp. SIO2B3]|uniref:substrate-binding domain-containing protein n=1 Tax=Okeania sp. SIO2B3 TaxID=2607784 RepID=UPI0013C1D597|nr:substrate-binding domain-containing protein [Okeania sp. SIO2B3]NET43513.1 substrate-binding domain-containing protein [Okeania sp. SIO2B3]
MTIAGCQISAQKTQHLEGKGCKDIGILLPATAAESGRWEEKDRHFLEKGIIEKIPDVTIRYFNANSNKELQEKQADLALKGGSCILIVTRVENEQGINIIKKAKKKGVPVIAYDRLIKHDDLSFYISFDSQEVGRLQADYVIQELNKGQEGIYKLEGIPNLVMINGGIDDENSHAIQESWFKRLNSYFQPEEFNQNKRLNLIFPRGKDDPQYFMPDWSGKKAAQKVNELLKNHQDNIQIILVANDSMANEIIGSLGDKRGKILITGQDGSAQSRKNIKNGFQGITIYKSSELLAKKTVELVVTLSEGKNTEDLINWDIEISKEKEIPSVILRPISVTKENIEVLD